MIETARGVITMSFPNYDLSLHIFRPELTQTFTWASSLFMSVDKERTGRPPFEALRQTIEKHSAPWTLHQMFMEQIFFDSMKNVLGNLDTNEEASLQSISHTLPLLWKEMRQGLHVLYHPVAGLPSKAGLVRL